MCALDGVCVCVCALIAEEIEERDGERRPLCCSENACAAYLQYSMLWIIERWLSKTEALGHVPDREREGAREERDSSVKRDKTE